jgi:hypothetical protein
MSAPDPSLYHKNISTASRTLASVRDDQQRMRAANKTSKNSNVENIAPAVNAKRNLGVENVNQSISPFTKEYQAITAADRQQQTDGLLIRHRHQHHHHSNRGGDVNTRTGTPPAPASTPPLALRPHSRPAVGNTPATPISAILNHLHELQLSPIQVTPQTLL